MFCKYLNFFLVIQNVHIYKKVYTCINMTTKTETEVFSLVTTSTQVINFQEI